LTTAIQARDFIFHVLTDGSLSIQNVKRNRDECIGLMENIHHILYAIVDLHINSETAGSLPPTTLNHIGKFTEYVMWLLGWEDITDSTPKNFTKDTHICGSATGWKQVERFLPPERNEHTTQRLPVWIGPGAGNVQSGCLRTNQCQSTDGTRLGLGPYLSTALMK
jgi:hypothetical protein